MAFYVTTPIYYVNAKPHLGHAYTTVFADAVARLHRALGEPTFFLTGTDEHGDKIEKAAKAQGVAPNVFADGVSAEFNAMLPALAATNDAFIRTTNPEHTTLVQTMLQKLFDRGEIYQAEYSGLYCTGCERFYTEKELENGLCPQHRVKPERIAEKNYFFRMGKYQAELIDHIKANPDFIRPERYRTEVLSLLESGALEDLCISRPKSRLTWGVELPFDAGYVCYVWFDALLNYVSGLGGPDADRFHTFWPEVRHIVAKDILKPHAVFWPTMLMALGLPLYKGLVVHGYWLSGKQKMSKSLGNVVEPAAMIGKYGLSAFRFYLLREMHLGSDADFTEEAFAARFNADLANDLGNLFNRTLNMAAKFVGSTVPQPGKQSEEDEAIATLCLESARLFIRRLKHFESSRALEALWEPVRALNKYIDHQAPWALAKKGETERLATVLYTALEGMRKTASCLTVVMPETAITMLNQLGAAPLPNLAREEDDFGILEPGTKLAATSTLFPRLEIAKPDAPKPEKIKMDKPQTTPPAAQTSPAGPIELADFQKIELKVGTILAAEKHPAADKLLVLTVDLGEEKTRTICAGIAEFWTPDDLLNRQVVVVANLAPRKLRGVESQGMVLAVKQDATLQLLAPSHTVVSGSRVS